MLSEKFNVESTSVFKLNGVLHIYGEIFRYIKNECTNLYEFWTEEAPFHRFNGYRTPYQAWIASKKLIFLSHECYKMPDYNR